MTSPSGIPDTAAEYPEDQGGIDPDEIDTAPDPEDDDDDDE